MIEHEMCWLCDLTQPVLLDSAINIINIIKNMFVSLIEM